MTETATQDEPEELDAETMDSLDAEAIADLVCDDPRVGLEMAKCVQAINNVVGMTFRLIEQEPESLVAISLQGLLMAHGLVRVRPVTEEDLKDEQRFAGFKVGEEIVEEAPAFTAARNAIEEAIGLAQEEMEDAQ